MNYRVFGLIRRSSTINFERIKHLQDEIELVPGDLRSKFADYSSCRKLNLTRFTTWPLSRCVPTSWSQPVLTGEFTALGVTRMLEAIRVVNPAVPLLSGLLQRNVRDGS